MTYSSVRNLLQCATCFVAFRSSISLSYKRRLVRREGQDLNAGRKGGSAYRRYVGSGPPADVLGITTRERRAAMGDARIYNLALKWSTHPLVSGISLWISRHGPTSRPSTIRSLLASAGASTVGPTANSTSAPSCRSTSCRLCWHTARPLATRGLGTD